MGDHLFGSADAGVGSANGSDGVRVRGGKRFIDLPGREQVSLQIRCVDDMVASDAYVRVLDEVMDELDYSALKCRYPGGGRPAHPPHLLCRLWVYAYTVGVRSARELSRRLETDLAFMWLARELRIDHETLSNFRRRFGEELKGIFKQTVVLAQEADLVSLAHVAIDGTKIAAHAERWMKDSDGLDRALSRLDERIDKLLAESDAADAAEDEALGRARGDEVSKELATAQRRRERIREAKEYLEEHGLDRVSVTDPEAPLQKTQDGKRPGYNCQAAVDAEAGIIVAESVSVSQNDRHEFFGVADSVVETTGRAPSEFAADSGYYSPETLMALESRDDVNAQIRPQLTGDEQAGRFEYHDFEYDSERDEYRCPGGGVLSFEKTVERRGTRSRSYRCLGSACKSCEFRGQCLRGDGRRRSILVPPHGSALTKLRRKAETAAGQAASLLRKCTVERVFGVIKAVMGLRQFLLRGLAGAAIEFRLAAIATNVQKLARWRLGQVGSAS